MEARREAPLSLAATEVFGRLTQEQLNSHHTRPRDLDPALQLNPSACQADFTYTMVLDVVKI